MKKETKKENTKKSFGAFEIIACISIVALMIVSVNCYIKKYEINYRSEVLAQEYEEAYNEGERLKVEYQKRTDYNDVTEYAETVLGMKKMSDYQIVYLPATEVDEMRVVSAGDSFADKLTKTFSVVLEYLR